MLTPPLRLTSLFLLLLSLAACKSKLEKKDLTLEEMQQGDGGKYTPILPDASVTPVYAQFDGTDLHLNIYYPEGHQEGDSAPCIVFFFGGGFINGSPEQFAEQCRHFSSKGYVAISADYRVISRNHCTAVESYKDAKSAVRYIRANAGTLGIAPNHIVVSGGSAGGGLALMCAMDVAGFNNPGDDTTISCRPDAIVGFNSVVDMEEHPFRIRKFDGAAAELSPIRHLHTQLPPTLVFHGTADEIAGYDKVKTYTEKAQAADADITLQSFEGMEHGFYQRNQHDGKYYTITLAETDKWLDALPW